ncbi:putative ABC transport system permease protein [Oikeobacillus pervagus]|uniref:Putative hemin transport system permease protein HrtB n=1 Tax=Oikeobacillus pervagus TaxID=1325931 RepID=A0AAJ1T516_9BACI|nr:ABC transporter permease [Oikeobacillus pervagus]MDQ0216746.1 putative ABC transport system permease protein [Oikeobacillus pervagus]
MFALSLKELTFYKLRYLLICFVLFFTSFLVYVISGLANGLSDDNASAVLGMNGEEFYIQKDADNRIDRSRIEKSTVDHYNSFNVQPLGIQMGSLIDQSTNKKVDISFMAVDSKHFLMPSIVEGKNLTNELSIVADSSLKDEGVKIGDSLFEETSELTFRIVGFTDNATFSHTPVTFISLKDWEKLTEKNGKVFYNGLVLKNKDPKIEKQVKEMIADGHWLPKEEIVNGIPGHEAEQSSLFMMLIFLIIITAFVLVAFFYIITIQKMNQFGILKAMGTKTSYLAGVTVIQVFTLSVVSIGASIGFTWVMRRVLPSDIPFTFDLPLILQYSAILLAVSIVGSLFSIVNISKADPIQAMGRVQ